VPQNFAKPCIKLHSSFFYIVNFRTKNDKELSPLITHTKSIIKLKCFSFKFDVFLLRTIKVQRKSNGRKLFKFICWTGQNNRLEKK
jgi:hypothetical protein